MNPFSSKSLAHRLTCGGEECTEKGAFDANCKAVLQGLIF